MQDSILVAGYPLGGDSLSITKGIVSRVSSFCIPCTCAAPWLAVVLLALCHFSSVCINKSKYAYSNDIHNYRGLFLSLFHGTQLSVLLS